MNEILQEQYKLAMEGKRCWLDIKKMYNIKCEDCLVILPSDNHELNKCAIKYKLGVDIWKKNISENHY